MVHKKVIFDLAAFSVVYTVVEEKLKSCDSCEAKDGKYCFRSVLLSALDSLDNSVYYEEEKKNTDELP